MVTSVTSGWHADRRKQLFFFFSPLAYIKKGKILNEFIASAQQQLAPDSFACEVDEVRMKQLCSHTRGGKGTYLPSIPVLITST